MSIGGVHRRIHQLLLIVAAPDPEPDRSGAEAVSHDSELIALSSQVTLTTNWIPKTTAGIQNTKIPFQANGPDLKNGRMTPGVKMIDAQMLR
jgi:hypothetical protein